MIIVVLVNIINGLPLCSSMAVVQSVLAWLQRFMEGFTPYLNKLVIFFLILFIGFLIGKILGRLIKKILADVKTDAFFRAKLGAKFSAERAISGFVTAVIYFLTIVLALDAVGLTGAVIELLVLLLVLALILSLFLAVKETVQNATAGLMRKPSIRPGAYIRMEEAEGEIKEVNILDTVIETRNGDTVIVPNSLLQKRTIKLLKRKPARRNDGKP